MDIDITPALAEAVQQARREQDLTHADIAAAGGPSNPTMTKIESGRGTISAASAKKLERALGWPQGEVRRRAAGIGPEQTHPLRAAREARGWSAYRMATELQVSAQQIERWERGEDMPPDRIALLRELFTPAEMAEALNQELRHGS